MNYWGHSIFLLRTASWAYLLWLDMLKLIQTINKSAFSKKAMGASQLLHLKLDWIKPYEIRFREQILLCQLHRLDDIIGVLVLKFLWILLTYESAWSSIKPYTEANIFLHSASVFREWVGLYDFGLPGLVCNWKQKDQSVARQVVLWVSLPW